MGLYECECVRDSMEFHKEEAAISKDQFNHFLTSLYFAEGGGGGGYNVLTQLLD